MVKNQELEPIMTKTGKEAVLLDEHPVWYNGHIYHDTGLKDYRNGKKRYHNCYRAEISINGKSFRHRSKFRKDCVEWLKAIKRGDIHPTDNKADWWRMEQKKDESVRIDEIIVSQAEESMLLFEYHMTKDLTQINEYIVSRLVPHMAYYSAHTLHLGREATITASMQAIGLLLTRITAGRPVLNFTATCKRMLRTYKQRGDFFYYENTPQDIKMMVNKIDFGPLAEMWKVVKDKRL